jgi:hypothetical protein
VIAHFQLSNVAFGASGGNVAFVASTKPAMGLFWPHKKYFQKTCPILKTQSSFVFTD